ncbi:two-component response regulator [Rufibacter sp. DG15C]|uniref:response regulator n=1 Tax=Rufibacter sp. DG15C TaxID=1379909 RepID=UPI00078C1812|nr:response regulator [Rufibacter sp. DG15C]AMM50258.1 two-component response regulator [Rufibacter sp. DG15C]
MSESQASILLVEDDYLDAMSVERELRKIKVMVPLHKAKNGREALAMLRGEPGTPKLSPLPTVVLLDINMPRMNGIEFLQEIRKDPSLSGLNVFIMTTSNEDSDRHAAQDLRVSGYIVKPLSFDSFGEGGSGIDSFSLFLDLLKLKPQ